jgi:hypothetical protein
MGGWGVKIENIDANWTSQEQYVTGKQKKNPFCKISYLANCVKTTNSQKDKLTRNVADQYSRAFECIRCSNLDKSETCGIKQPRNSSINKAL